MRFKAEIHKAAEGMTLVQVVAKNYPDDVQDYWLDPDGVHLHAVWDITKAGKPDKRKKAQSLLRRLQNDYQGKPYYAGHYILATPDNVAKLKAAQAKIQAAREALDAAVDRRDAALALGLVPVELDGGAE